VIETMAKISMATLLIAASPLDAPEPALWAQWGLAGVVVAYVLWRDHQREKRMATAIEAQQRWIRETLVKTLERNASAMERMVTWLEANEQPAHRRITAVTEGALHGDDR
jgi:hypothetical protein